MELLRTLLIATLLVGCALMAHGKRGPGGKMPDPPRRDSGVCGFVLEGVENEGPVDCSSNDKTCSVEIEFTIDGVNASLSLCEEAKDDDDDSNDDDDRERPYHIGLFRNACHLTSDTVVQKSKLCPNNVDCNRGPVEITVDGNALSGMFCAGDATWYSIFSSPPPRRGSGERGGRSSSSSSRSSSSSSSDEKGSSSQGGRRHGDKKGGKH